MINGPLIIAAARRRWRHAKSTSEDPG